MIQILIVVQIEIKNYIKTLGVDYYSTPVGERYVVAKMNEVGGAVGGEESGHVVAADYCRTGDALMPHSA